LGKAPGRAAVPAGGLLGTASEVTSGGGAAPRRSRRRVGRGVPAGSGRGGGAFRGVLGAVVSGRFSSLLLLKYSCYTSLFSICCLLKIIPRISVAPSPFKFSVRVFIYLFALPIF